MNLKYSNTLRTAFCGFLCFGFFMLEQSVFGQTSYTAKIVKNTNISARTLVHELNTTKDTLLLASNSQINHIYSINEDFKREIDMHPFKKQYKLPLANFTKGKHVLVVSQDAKKIIFVVYITDPETTVERT
ncbi:hypothetical protein ACFSQP_11620 [Bizionia sediminis]|uniref:Uncharacterized protein n=1 Tax=Bizionia sediminis TaxID=1737064 RepID=A0ABW5KV53_9FLAO